MGLSEVEPDCPTVPWCGCVQLFLGCWPWVPHLGKLACRVHRGRLKAAHASLRAWVVS